MEAGKLKIILYGGLAETLGREVDAAATPGCTVAQLRRQLAAAYPNIAGQLLRPSNRAFVNDAAVREDFSLAGAETVEFLPPLSGG